MYTFTHNCLPPASLGQELLAQTPIEDSGSYELIFFNGNEGNGNKSKGDTLICLKYEQIHVKMRICS